jgi:4-alpha-glucanotransferase
VADVPPFPKDRVDYGWALSWKMPLLQRSLSHFQAHASSEQRARFDAFCREQAGWLDDFALFMALKTHHQGACWDTWPLPITLTGTPCACLSWRSGQGPQDRLDCPGQASTLTGTGRTHQPQAVAEGSGQLADATQMQHYFQWLFFEQWSALRTYADERGVRIIGDLPIFVAYDSADAWANPELFYFDDHGRPTAVAGVPPDYFSPTGQLWGNPIYRWDVMAQAGYTWWIERFRAAFRLVDIVRLDHFRGFQTYWEVPAGEETAVNGRWVEGPGEALFSAVRAALGDVPIIAEDLGVITPEVEALRDGLGFPGMRVLQFAFGGPASHPYLPHNHVPHCVVYTGTHDNDTTVGWYRSAPPEVQDHVRRYLARDGHDVAWDMIRAALSSVAEMAIVPMQDVLALGSEARMNTPGQASGNWAWRLRWEQLDPWIAPRLAEMTRLYDRAPEKQT